MARSKSPQPAKTLRFTVTPAEAAQIFAASLKLNCSMAEFLRTSALVAATEQNKRIPGRPPETEEAREFRRLARMLWDMYKRIQAEWGDRFAGVFEHQVGDLTQICNDKNLNELKEFITLAPWRNI